MNERMKWWLVSKLGFVLFLSPWLYLLLEPYHGTETLSGWWMLFPVVFGPAIWGFGAGRAWEKDND